MKYSENFLIEKRDESIIFNDSCQSLDNRDQLNSACRSIDLLEQVYVADQSIGDDFSLRDPAPHYPFARREARNSGVRAGVNVGLDRANVKLFSVLEGGNLQCSS